MYASHIYKIDIDIIKDDQDLIDSAEQFVSFVDFCLIYRKNRGQSCQNTFYFPINIILFWHSYFLKWKAFCIFTMWIFLFFFYCYYLLITLEIVHEDAWDTHEHRQWGNV